MELELLKTNLKVWSVYSNGCLVKGKNVLPFTNLHIFKGLVHHKSVCLLLSSEHKLR